jgi:MFS family permease
MQNLMLFRHNKPFTFLWLARLVSFSAETLTTTGLVLFAARQNNSATLVSTLLFAQALPRLFGPLIGNLADRQEKRWFMSVCFLGKMVATFSLLLLLERPMLIPVVVALSTIFSTGYSITGRSVLPALVKDEDIQGANALTVLSLNIALAIGPSVAGILFEVIDVNDLLWMSGGLFLFSALWIRNLPAIPALIESASDVGFLKETWSGIRYQFMHGMARSISISLFITVVFAAYGSLALVFLVQDVLGESPAQYGLVQSLYGLGMVLGPLISLRFVGKITPKYMLIAAIAFLGAGNLLTGLAPSLIVVIFTMGLAGMGNGLQNLANDSLIQQSVSRQKLGRVFGNIYSGAHLAAVLAYAIGGPILVLTSPRFVYITAGIGVFVSLVVLMFLFQRLTAASGSRGSSIQDKVVEQVFGD